MISNSNDAGSKSGVANPTNFPCPHPTLAALPGGCPICVEPLELDAVALEASILRDSFAAFAERYWPVVTGAPLVPNRATDAITGALQRVADAELTRLLIAVPPGTGKSTLLALYAAWRLARDAGHRSIHAAHAYELAATESRRVRRLVESDAYRALFPVALRDDESTVAHWATTSDGRYIACGTDGGLTGRRAHEAICDDPLNAPDRYSRAARDGLWAWFTETLLSRLDGDRAPVIVVQQRLDVDDLIGRLLAAGGWELIELPAEADGELLAPEILPREKLDTLRAQMGSAAYACQFLQRPASDETASIKRAWWGYYKPGDLPAMDRVVIACDLTFGSAKGDYAAIQAWGARGGARYLLRAFRERCGFEDQLGAIRSFAGEFPGAKIIVEKAANGAAVIETLQRELAGVVPEVPTGSKAQRLGAVAPTIESGSCYLPAGAAWVGDFVEELAGASKHDDQADAAAYALLALAGGDEQRDARRDAIRLYSAIPDAVRRRGLVDAWVDHQLENAARRDRGETEVRFELPPEPKPERKPGERPDWVERSYASEPAAMSTFERVLLETAQGGVFGGGAGWRR